MNASKRNPGGWILIVDDVPANLSLLVDTLEAAGHRVVAAPSGEVALQIAAEACPDVVLMDVMMPGMDGFETCRRLKEIEALREVPVLFITARDEPQDVEAGFEAGGVDYIAKPFRLEEVVLRVETHLRLRQLTRDLRDKNAALEAEIERRNRAERERDASNARLRVLRQQDAERWGISGLVGQSRTFRQLLDTISKAAGFEASPVLILGESGTGKELLARAIHDTSAHREGPFVPVNCSAIPGELAESLLFGHVKGAFTGAMAERPGYFELADGGTLFLDEISELPPALQPKFLRALEEGEVRPVGASHGRAVRTSIIAASNANFAERIAQGRFRPDLYFRLARFTVEVPSLRDRREDIPLLAHHFVQVFAREMNLPPPPISNTALQALVRHEYPGNVRELKNLIERALMESEGGELRPEHLRFFGIPVLPSGPNCLTPGPGMAVGASSASDLPASGGSEEARVLGYVRAHGVITNTLVREVLGVDRNHASYMLHKLSEQGLLVGEGQGRWVRYRLP
ncbi:MAG: sigma-54-dependent Fis family transcriptional regulator [Verrucomicrobiales bacterium]|nr:sigma-54-dependent Fis family transcriptional regulator [Verrucomicrobiales bacterium]